MKKKKNLVRRMFEAVDILEIVLDYITHLKQSLKGAPAVLTLFILPALLSAGIYSFVQCPVQFKNFSDKLVTINSIFIPLLINVLMIVQYSTEREREKERGRERDLDKIEDRPMKGELLRRKRKVLRFLERISSATAMSVLIGLILLLLGVIFSDTYVTKGYIYIAGFHVNVIIFMVVFIFSFWIINIVIILVRVYRLIRYDINEY